MAGAVWAPATVAAAPVGRCPRGTASAVSAAYTTVFSRATQLSADQRAASLARGDDPSVRALLERWLADDAGASSSVTVASVRCTSRRRAIVDADLMLSGVTLPEVLPAGRAIREGGTWKVALATFCHRLVLETPSLAGHCPE